MLDPLINAFLLVSNLPANATIDLLALDTSAGDVFILEKMEKARIKYIMVPCKMCNAGNFEDAMETLGMVRLGNSTTQFNFLLYRNAKLTEPINVDFPTVFSFN